MRKVHRLDKELPRNEEKFIITEIYIVATRYKMFSFAPCVFPRNGLRDANTIFFARQKILPTLTNFKE